jgi:hypothetical protein
MCITTTLTYACNDKVKITQRIPCTNEEKHTETHHQHKRLPMYCYNCVHSRLFSQSLIMSGAANTSDLSNISRIESWIKKYDEEAATLLRGQESAPEGVRDFGLEQAAYLKVRGKMVEKWLNGVEKRGVGEDEEDKVEEPKLLVTKLWNLVDGRISRIGFYRDKE